MTPATLTLSSVGDVVAVVQLAWQLRQSLAEAATASSEIQALVDDIDSFKSALESARVLLEETADVPQSVHNGVTHTMNVCAGLLRHAEAKILMRRKEMVSAHGWSSWRAVWSVCAWTILGGKADVEALKHRLAEQMLALQTLLNVLQSASLPQIDRRATADRTTMARILEVLELFPALLLQAHPGFHFFEVDGTGVQPLMKVPYETISVLLGDVKREVLPPDSTTSLVLVVRRAVPHKRGGLFDHILKIQCFRYKDSRTFGSDVVLISPPLVNARGVYPRRLSKRGARSDHDWLKSDLVFSQMVETIFTKAQTLKLPRRHRILSPDYVPTPVLDENLWLGQEARDWNDVLIAPVKDGPAVCVTGDRGFPAKCTYQT